MNERCVYCGREEGESDDGYIHLMKCPVCNALACCICHALIEFSEAVEDDEDMVQTWRSVVCKVHLSWNIIEGIKKNATEVDEEDNEQTKNN